MKILIGHDGSESSQAILTDLKFAGLPSEADVIVFTIAELWLLPTNRSGLLETDFNQLPLDIRLAQSLAEQACHDIQSAFPIWRLEPKSALGSPAQKILQLADQWQPDLIIVGSQGQSALGRFIFGSVSQKVVTEANCSVRVARLPHNCKTNRPVKIVIGVDGSENAATAARVVATRQWPAGSEVLLITAESAIVNANLSQAAAAAGQAVPPMSSRPAVYTVKIESLLQDQVADQLSANGLKISQLVKPGDAKQVLINSAEEWLADSIFLGCRGFGRVKRFLLGSVSAAVVARAECSVEVVR